MKHMQMIRHHSLVLLSAAGVLLAVSGCGGELQRVTPALVAEANRGGPPTVSAETLEAGRTLYVTRCGSCHGLPAIAAYEQPAWKSWVRRMAPKARIDAAQESALLTYLLAGQRLTNPSPYEALGAGL